MHCVGDADSDQTLVEFQTEDAIAELIGDRDDDFVDDMVSFGLDYAATVRDDHRHFVEAFREGRDPRRQLDLTDISLPTGCVINLAGAPGPRR